MWLVAQFPAPLRGAHRSALAELCVAHAGTHDLLTDPRAAAARRVSPLSSQTAPAPGCVWRCSTGGRGPPVGAGPARRCRPVDGQRPPHPTRPRVGSSSRNGRAATVTCGWPGAVGSPAHRGPGRARPRPRPHATGSLRETATASAFPWRTPGPATTTSPGGWAWLMYDALLSERRLRPGGQWPGAYARRVGLGGRLGRSRGRAARRPAARWSATALTGPNAARTWPGRSARRSAGTPWTRAGAYASARSGP